MLWKDRERVAEWVRVRIPYITSWGEWYEAIGLQRDGVLIGGCVYNFYTVSDIAISVASDGSGHWLTRDFLRAVFGYPFNQLKVRRLTSYIASRNAASLRFNAKLGFTTEGILRHALPDDDLILRGMLRSECRYI